MFSYPVLMDYELEQRMRIAIDERGYPFSQSKDLETGTGNALLDSTLRQVTFRRKSRIKYNWWGQY